MEKVLCVLFIVLPALALAEKPAPKPADYTIVIHVQSSRMAPDCRVGGNGFCGWYLSLNVLIDGKKYELANSGASFELLRVGDYKARIVKEDTMKLYEISRTYEFLFADGSTRDFFVAGESE
ncbi:MAG: hypothetical protein ABSB60_07610 [Terracidiphilus sp.]|jgi:hypothetical protein